MTKKCSVSLGTVSKLKVSRNVSVILTYIKDFIPECSHISLDALHYCLVWYWPVEEIGARSHINHRLRAEAFSSPILNDTRPTSTDQYFGRRTMLHRSVHRKWLSNWASTPSSYFRQPSVQHNALIRQIVSWKKYQYRIWGLRTSHRMSPASTPIILRPRAESNFCRPDAVRQKKPFPNQCSTLNLATHGRSI